MPNSDQHARLRAPVLTPPVLTVLRYAASALVVAASTVTGWFAFGPSDLADVVMLVLLGVAVVSLRFGYGPSLLAATLSAMAFEFFFLPPYLSLAIANLHHIVTFGVMLTIALVISHLTQRLRDEAEKVRRASLRAQTEQHRSTLLSSVSHDLRTPLAVITGATSAMLSSQAPQDEGARRALLEAAYREARRLDRLVRNLLEMARLEAGDLTIRKEWQPLEEVIGGALNHLEERLRGRDIDARIPKDLPLLAFDSVLVQQVLINMVENAAKYAPAESPIELSAIASDSEVTIEVADRGPGVPESHRELVFDKFYRVRESEGGGVGLGLTICRAIVSAHGGRIWVSQRGGGGACFRFTLPLDAPEVAHKTQ
jgi:K+-sensing histidine kinase KdpD